LTKKFQTSRHIVIQTRWLTRRKLFHPSDGIGDRFGSEIPSCSYDMAALHRRILLIGGNGYIGALKFNFKN
jgi:hypothetical protein